VPIPVVLVGLAVGAQVDAFAVFPAAGAYVVAGVLLAGGEAIDGVPSGEEVGVSLIDPEGGACVFVRCWEG